MKKQVAKVLLTASLFGLITTFGFIAIIDEERTQSILQDGGVKPTSDYEEKPQPL